MNTSFIHFFRPANNPIKRSLINILPELLMKKTISKCKSHKNETQTYLLHNHESFEAKSPDCKQVFLSEYIVSELPV
jgi:hypothetical protein